MAENEIYLCDYGCEQEAKFQMTNGKWCCQNYYSKCPEIRRRNSETNKIKQAGEKNAMYGRHHKPESKEKIAKKATGRTPWNLGIEPYNKGISLEEMYGIEKADEIKEKRSIKLKGKSYVDLHGEDEAERIKNVLSNLMLGWNTRISEEELKSRKENQSIGISNSYLNGNRKSFKTKYLSGRYINRFGIELYYQSSYELAFFRILDRDENVTSFRRPDFFITYDLDGEIKRYIPDVIVTYNNIKDILYEIKPLIFLRDKVNILKFKAAKALGKIKNFKFKVTTEHKIQEEIDLVYKELNIK